MREKIAEEELTIAKSKLDEAKRMVIQREKELEEYKGFRKEEENRLYEEVINKKVKKNAYTDLKHEFAKLKQKEVDKETAVMDAESAVEDAKQVVDDARQHYQQLVMSKEKILEHKKSWEAEYKREKELLEDIELEEFQAKQLEFE